MPSYFAFLRAINVSNRFVKMADLRQIFADGDYEPVESYIQSGNIIFTAPKTDPAALGPGMNRETL